VSANPFLLSAIVLGILVSYRLNLLSVSGAAAAAVLAFFLAPGGGIGLLPALLFFLPSSLVSRPRDSRVPGPRLQPRNAFQVLANGAPATACYVLWMQTSDPCWVAAMVASFAAASSDTWSSELGFLSKRQPRLITNLRVVRPGTSGAVSRHGFLAGAVGSVVVVLGFYFFAALLYSADIVPTSSGNPIVFMTERAPLVITLLSLAGFVAGIVDSVVGASIQERFREPITGETVENLTLKEAENAGRKADFRISGIAGVNNDVVNLICSVSGAFFGLLICTLV
jgi:uncharacterized protein (TIGR00297 family)